MTTHLQLPFQFDVQALQKELDTILDMKWVAHFNTGGYIGNWNAIPLYAPNGDSEHIFAVSMEDAPLQATGILKECDYLRTVIQSFETEILSARLLRLEAGAFIKPHTDHALGYEDGSFRVHIPIATNPQVQFVLAGTQIRMQPGECWYTNVNHEHSVRNDGTTDRVHLVIDLKRNEWSDALFFSLAPKASFEREVDKVSSEILKRTLEELRRQHLPANQRLIEQLEKQLAAGASQ
ncbi:MAG: aspartyl/asparaginyl beta-hydroxylase domain-containing protein [Marinirhabdus sp.]|nr:aspartyl/asparaginyl beta-hydroxylase domain-containing protein [Marinirhabdus sp.]